MRLFVSLADRVHLRTCAALSPALAHARACCVVLWVARGFTVARVARSFGLSRPTVYRILRLWAEFRDVAALHPDVAGRLRPWRWKPPGR